MEARSGVATAGDAMPCCAISQAGLTTQATTRGAT